MAEERKISIDPAYRRTKVVDGLLPLLESAARDPAYNGQVEAYMRKHDGEAAEALMAVIGYGPNSGLLPIDTETVERWMGAAEGTLHSKSEEARRLLRADSLRPYEPEVVAIEGDMSHLWVDRADIKDMPEGSVVDSRETAVVYTDSHCREYGKQLIRALKGKRVEDFVNSLEWREIGTNHLGKLKNQN